MGAWLRMISSLKSARSTSIGILTSTAFTGCGACDLPCVACTTGTRAPKHTQGLEHQCDVRDSNVTLLRLKY